MYLLLRGIILAVRWFTYEQSAYTSHVIYGETEHGTEVEYMVRRENT